MENSVWLWNKLPKIDSGYSPEEIFTSTHRTHEDLKRTHVWGCPVYVLDPRMQDGKKIPKWEPRAKRGQFLGFSKRHSSTVGLIRNLKTGSVSPQYHVVYDDLYQTIPNIENGGIDMREHPEVFNWDKLFKSGNDYYLDEEYDDEGKLLDPPGLSKECGYIPNKISEPKGKLKVIWDKNVIEYFEEESFNIDRISKSNGDTPS